jgi:hypothetical protein
MVSAAHRRSLLSGTRILCLCRFAEHNIDSLVDNLMAGDCKK